LSEADDDADRERRVEMSVEPPTNHASPGALHSLEIEPSAPPRLRIARDDSAPDDLLMIRRVV
jgi:hypothetical protein